MNILRSNSFPSLAITCIQMGDNENSLSSPDNAEVGTSYKLVAYSIHTSLNLGNDEFSFLNGAELISCQIYKDKKDLKKITSLFNADLERYNHMRVATSQKWPTESTRVFMFPPIQVPDWGSAFQNQKIYEMADHTSTDLLRIYRLSEDNSDKKLAKIQNDIKKIKAKYKAEIRTARESEEIALNGLKELSDSYSKSQLSNTIQLQKLVATMEEEKANLKNEYEKKFMKIKFEKELEIEKLSHKMTKRMLVRRKSVSSSMA